MPEAVVVINVDLEAKETSLLALNVERYDRTRLVGYNNVFLTSLVEDSTDSDTNKGVNTDVVA